MLYKHGGKDLHISFIRMMHPIKINHLALSHCNKNQCNGLILNNMKQFRILSLDMHSSNIICRFYL